ncbi:MAG: aspartate kinase [Saprospirales bacterium]|nr:aspartate kinase [Saprospirales bacterium]MBK8492461.1 aspartate kinase [Saprospirales bacterium]
MKNLKVFKFGGSSVRDAANIKNVASILQSFTGRPILIVVSAMGKTTNALEEVVAAQAARNGKALEILNSIKEQHYQIMSELFDPGDEVFAAVNDHFVTVEWVLEEEPHENYDYMYDQIICVGELVSSTIMAAYLNKAGLPTSWLDARDVILTDDIYREGWVQWDETVEKAKAKALPLLEKGGFVLTQGFIGSTTENATTTLGREGSDYTAAIFSFCLDAEDMTIWKDVPGVLTADPRLFDNVVKLDRLSYREAIEMTYYGAKVIHPKTIKPLQNKNIPLFVKSFIDPKGEGTLISSDVEDHYPPMVALERNQALVYISTRDFSFVAEHHMSVLFTHIANLRLQVNMMQNTAISFVVCVNDIDDKVDRFAQHIQGDFKVLIDRNLELITVRHAQPAVLENLRKGKILLMEERTKDTVQMVVKNVQVVDWKEVG